MEDFKDIGFVYHKDPYYSGWKKEIGHNIVELSDKSDGLWLTLISGRKALMIGKANKDQIKRFCDILEEIVIK
jgi:hypothetical protein